LHDEGDKRARDPEGGRHIAPALASGYALPDLLYLNFRDLPRDIEITVSPISGDNGAARSAPRLSAGNPAHPRTRYSIVAGDSIVAFTSRHPPPYAFDGHGGKPSPALTLPMSAAPFRPHIAHVLGVVAKEQMSRIDARGDITSMQHVAAKWNRADE